MSSRSNVPTTALPDPDASASAVATTPAVVATAVVPGGSGDAAPAPPRRRGRPRKIPVVAADALADGMPPGAASPAAVSPPPRPSRPGLTARGLAAGASDRARLVAAMVLEVFAAVRSPADAAAVLGVVPVRYYQLETRALAGLIRGCEPAAKGRPAASTAMDDRVRSDHFRLQGENRRLIGEVARLQTLLRTARAAFGLRPEATPKPVPAGKPGKPGKRRPRMRALRLAGLLRPAASTPSSGPATLATSPAGG